MVAFFFCSWSSYFFTLIFLICGFFTLVFGFFTSVFFYEVKKPKKSESNKINLKKPKNKKKGFAFFSSFFFQEKNQKRPSILQMDTRNSKNCKKIYIFYKKNGPPKTVFYFRRKSLFKKSRR